MTSQPEHRKLADRMEDVSIEELARQQGVQPVTSVEELARPWLFDSDEEFEAFLADLHASRQADAL